MPPITAASDAIAPIYARVKTLRSKIASAEDAIAFARLGTPWIASAGDAIAFARTRHVADNGRAGRYRAHACPCRPRRHGYPLPLYAPAPR